MRFDNMKILVLLGVAMLAAATASAGTISIAWDPVTDTDLVGYRIYWGTAHGTYTQQQDVGLVTTATLSGMPDCSTLYVAIKARDAAGNVSPSYSNEIVGFPRPVVISATPTSAEQGLPLSVVIAGANFASGASVQFGNPAITVNSVAVTSCTLLTATVTIAPGAAIGASTIDVTNPDRVFGTANGLFTVVAAVPPTVGSVSPASLATGVSLNVHPTVTFSEAMKVSTITASSVVLLDSGGNAVAQAAGSPALTPDGRTATIVPAAALANNRVYKLQVLGGTTGVRDLAGNAMVSTWAQASGFTTVTDTGAPVLTALAATASSTTAQISWTTSEPADGQVFYRKGTDVVYQQSSLDTTLGTSHSVQIQGLAPSTQYFYYVQSADGAGNSASSSPDGSFTTSANAYTYIAIEPESGTLVAPVRATTGAGSFRNAWVDTPAGTITGTATIPAGKVDLGFHVPADGTWYLWLRLYGASTASDAWFESIDGASRQQVVPSTTGQWKWAAARSYTLTQGLHNLEIGGKEAQARADRVLITNDPTFVPTEQPTDDTTPPAAAAGIAAAASSGAVTLNWTNPSADVAQVVVRYRTDGRYPTTPADGLPALSRSASPSAPETYVHSGLVTGTTYSYSVFELDASGNASAPAQVQAAPVDNQPPPTVGGARRTDTH